MRVRVSYCTVVLLLYCCTVVFSFPVRPGSGLLLYCLVLSWTRGKDLSLSLSLGVWVYCVYCVADDRGRNLELMTWEGEKSIW